MKLTTTEWKEIEEALKSIYYFVRLDCDGYILTISLTRVTQFKNVIRVYVNGSVKGEWLQAECEESRRFFKKITRHALSPQKRKQYMKLPKKLQKELNLDRSVSYYTPDWTSFNSLKKQLIAQNESIRLVSSDWRND